MKTDNASAGLAPADGSPIARVWLAQATRARDLARTAQDWALRRACRQSMRRAALNWRESRANTKVCEPEPSR